jgi:hypothetical protein
MAGVDFNNAAGCSVQNKRHKNKSRDGYSLQAHCRILKVAEKIERFDFIRAYAAFTENIKPVAAYVDQRWKCMVLVEFVYYEHGTYIFKSADYIPVIKEHFPLRNPVRNIQQWFPHAVYYIMHVFMPGHAHENIRLIGAGLAF